jgi:hypothetical protein
MTHKTGILDYTMGALFGAAIALAGTVIAVEYVERSTPEVPCCEEVTPKGEPVEAPESPVEAAEPEEVLPAPQEQETPPAPRPRRRRPRKRAVNTINLESDDPWEGI